MSDLVCSSLRTGERLVQDGVLTESTLRLILITQSRLTQQGRKLPIGEVAVRLGLATRSQVEEAIRSTGNMSSGFAHIALPAGLLRSFRCMPLAVDGDVLMIAAHDELSPADKNLLAQAARDAGYDVSTVTQEPRDRGLILDHLQKLSHVDSEAVERDVDAFCSNPADGSLLQKLVPSIFQEALQMRASDIHIERSSDPLFCDIRYRIDGRLHTRYVLTVDAMGALMSRIKNQADMDISEMRRPQDGRTSVEYHGNSIDCRVSTTPTEGGETAVVRLLDQSRIQTSLIQFRRYPEIMQGVRALTKVYGKEGGLVLVTGPTGSGKTTTLSGMIYDMPRSEIKVKTIEDPVEINIPLVDQAQINNTVGFNYAAAIRAYMRQDPDVILVGEMRDQETTVEALKASETGHLVLSTLHTNDVVDSLSRIINNIPEESKSTGLYTLANRLKAVFNQRLARRLCSCSVGLAEGKVELAPRHHRLLALLEISNLDSIRAPKGCVRCGNSGHMGREMVVEAVFFPNDSRIRQEMEAILYDRSSGGAGVLDIRGVHYFSRRQSVAVLLKSGAIDLDEAISILDLGLLTLEDEGILGQRI